MERGRALLGVACAGISGASHRSPSATFATDKPSKEAHDSEVLVTQCRRRRRSRCGNPQRRPATRAPATKPARSLRGPRPGVALPCGQRSRSPPLEELPRDDGVGFLSNVTDEVREPTRSDGDEAASRRPPRSDGDEAPPQRPPRSDGGEAPPRWPPRSDGEDSYDSSSSPLKVTVNTAFGGGPISSEPPS